MLTALPQPPIPAPATSEHHGGKASHQAWKSQGTIPYHSSSTYTWWRCGRSQGLCPLQQARAEPFSVGGKFTLNSTGIFTRLQVVTLVSAYPFQMSISNQAQMHSFSKEMLLSIKSPSEEKTILLLLLLQANPLALFQLSGDTSHLWTRPS